MPSVSPVQDDARAARQLLPIALANAIGNGLFFSTSALYFTRIVGITTTQLGIGLTAGGICGALASVPAARAAEHWGPKRVIAAVWLLEAAGMVAYSQVRSFAAFIPLVCAVLMVDRASGAGYRVLLARALTAENRARARSQLRAAANVGMGTGAAVGAIALQADTRQAYTAALAVNALSFVLAAAMLSRLALPKGTSARIAPSTGPPSTERGGRARFHVLRDRPYLVITFLSMILTLQFGLLEVGLPLWIARHTSAPHATVAAALVVNTAMIALLQVRLSRGSDDLRRAARLCRRCGWLLAAACAVYALAAGLAPWLAVIVLLTAAVTQTFAEIYYSVGTMALSYDLAPATEGSAHHGVFQVGYIVAMLTAPVIITNTALRFGGGGWLLLAALFAVSGALVVPAGRWALRRAGQAAAEPYAGVPAL
jgi:MFS family permease